MRLHLLHSWVSSLVYSLILVSSSFIRYQGKWAELYIEHHLIHFIYSSSLAGIPTSVLVQIQNYKVCLTSHALGQIAEMIDRTIQEMSAIPIIAQIGWILSHCILYILGGGHDTRRISSRILGIKSLVLNASHFNSRAIPCSFYCPSRSSYRAYRVYDPFSRPSCIIGHWLYYHSSTKLYCLDFLGACRQVYFLFYSKGQCKLTLTHILSMSCHRSITGKLCFFTITWITIDWDIIT